MVTTLITLIEAKLELGITDSDSDTLLSTLIDAVISIFEDEIDRKLESAGYIEYYSSEGNESCIFLKNRPVTEITSIYDDPDWDFDVSDLLSSDDYTYNADNGIVYYNGQFFKGFNSIKVKYTAGYTQTTLPKSIKQCLIRQMAVWYKDAKGAEWAKSVVSQPGGGTITKKELKNNLLPDFISLTEKYRDWHC